MTVFDSSSIEAFVTENNPKYANRIIKQFVFDSVAIYKELLAGTAFGVNDDGGNKHFSKAYIPLNSRSHLENQDYTVNGNGIPCCLHDSSLQMKPEGVLTTKSRIKKYKFVCPKMTWDYDPENQHSHRKCTSSKCGRMVYIYPEKNLCAYSRTLHDTEDWDNTYKIRTTIKHSINYFKNNFYLTKRKTQNE